MTGKKNIYRILDANLNRSKEGLRVCEEVVRFALNDKKLTAHLRRLRHEISRAADKLPLDYASLLASRNSKEDVGKNFSTERQIKKINYHKIFLRNLQRVKEALRVLEEFCLFLDQKVSKQFQHLRFKIYNLEKTIYERL